ncbi:transcription antitermination factor NusB [Pokkaliibacter plantistimulans]|uniref:Transcription antitermination protein NusB n=1 Tax=Proteobacteria bacterium 228 TaxID=2083153 RepID=A0A2S5KQ26_9PROT|nr:transcription antitermination factor NusB [Pokkaliibacter plantistimulans]PPC76944.1 transcription antitermination factor NusB [Pokkaliibacter plantistimulans]
MSQDKPVKKEALANKRRNARQFSLQALYQWSLAGGNLTDIEVQFRTDNDMSKTDLTLLRELLHGVPAKVAELDEHLQPKLDRALKDLDPVEKCILRMGAYELAFRLEVPYRVVINECVELAKLFGATDSHKYINGVLDRVARELRAAETQRNNRPA